MPPDRRTLEPLGLLLAQEIEVGERVDQRRVSEFAERHLGAHRFRCWIALVKRPCAEPSEVTNACSHEEDGGEVPAPVRSPKPPRLLPQEGQEWGMVPEGSPTSSSTSRRESRIHAKSENPEPSAVCISSRGVTRRGKALIESRGGSSRMAIQPETYTRTISTMSEVIETLREEPDPDGTLTVLADRIRVDREWVRALMALGDEPRRPPGWLRRKPMPAR